MTYLEAVILGLVQGLAEFLPISSSGHLALLEQFFGIEEDKVFIFTVMLHLGTLVSVFIIYWKDIWGVVGQFFCMLWDIIRGKGARFDEKPIRKFALMLFIACIPTALMGFFLDDFFDSLYTSIIPIGIGFIITGIILKITDGYKKTNKTAKEMSVWDALIIGTIQGCAMAPGISRSGSTLFGALSTKLEREFAVEFVFLVSIPPIVGSAIFEIPEALEQGIDMANLGPIAVGVLVAAVCGFVAIKTMIRLVSKKKLSIFSWYLWILGLCVVGYGLYQFI